MSESNRPLYGVGVVNLESIDANLLVALDVLVAERSVTQAAKRLGLSQPAMSNALGRLRKLFGDPLLIPRRGGMQPTPRASELVRPIHRALADIRRTLAAPDAFDPARSSQRFQIAATDYVSLVVLPSLMCRLQAVAPNVEVETVPLGDRLPEEDLRSGRLDLALGSFAAGRASPIRHEDLFDDRFVVVMREGHPRSRRRLTVSEFAQLSQVVALPRGRLSSPVDQRLAELGIQPRVALTTSHVLVAARVVAQTDLVTMLAGRLVGLSDIVRLRVRPLPFTLPKFTVSMVWHERAANEASIRWFRDQLRSICRGLRRPGTSRRAPL